MRTGEHTGPPCCRSCELASLGSPSATGADVAGPKDLPHTHFEGALKR